MEKFKLHDRVKLSAEGLRVFHWAQMPGAAVAR